MGLEYGISRIALDGPGHGPIWVDADRPSPAIRAQLQGSMGRNSEIEIGYYSPPSMTTIIKPPYRVPSMAEIASLSWNGFNVVSTFSGCGGSCLGYRMGGFRVLWANEFVPAARECYKANHPGSILDTRDIRKVGPEDILDAIGLGVGEIDVLDGSPPCASFSTAGKREAGWGKVKTYSDTKQRTDDLFFEHARLLEGLKPKAFVAENVSGLVKGTAKGYFLEILGRLKGCGYRVDAKILDAQWLGVPQARQRLIFVGVRQDLKLSPAFPRPLPYRYSVRDAIGIGLRPKSYAANEWTGGGRPAAAIQASGQYWCDEGQRIDLEGLAHGREWSRLKPGEHSEKFFNLQKCHPDQPSPTVVAAAGGRSIAGVTHPIEKRKFSIAELRRICAFPDDFKLAGNYSQQWERLGRAVPPVMMGHIASVIRDQILKKL